MSWHTSCLAIEGDQARRGSALFADLGFPHLAEVAEVSGDQAGSLFLRGRALGLVRGWTFVWDPLMFYDLDGADKPADGSFWSAHVENALLALSRDGRIYAFTTEGTSGSHGFAWYTQGQRHRLRLSVAGTVRMQHGEPLPEELQTESEESDEEQRLFLLMEKLTGISIHDVVAERFKLFS